MFYHIYLVSRENDNTTVEYKKTVENINAVKIDNIPVDKLVIPVIVSTETEEIPDNEDVLSHKNISISNPIIRIPIPTVEVDRKGNITSNDNNTIFYLGDTLVNSPIHRTSIDYTNDTITVYGKAYRDIDIVIPEINKHIKNRFYSKKSNEFTLNIKEELPESRYTITHIDFDLWSITNTSNFPIFAYNNNIPAVVRQQWNELLREGEYNLISYEGIIQLSRSIVLESYIQDLSFCDTQIFTEQVDDDHVTFRWELVGDANKYEVYIDNDLVFTTIDETFYTFEIPKHKLSYNITLKAYNKFSSLKRTLKAYSFTKPEIPTVNIRGIDDVVFEFPATELDSATVLVYGVEHATNKYKFLGKADARDREFKLTSSMLEFNKFTYKYAMNNSYSEYSDIFDFDHPLILNRFVSIDYLDKITDEYWQYELRWCPDPKAMGYSVHKNNIEVATLPANAYSYEGYGYVGDFLCVHSYYGLKEAESSIIYIGDVTGIIPISNVSNLNIDKIEDKTVYLSWDNQCVGSFLVDILVFDKNGNKVKVFSNLDVTELSFTTPNYDEYSLSVKTKRRDGTEETGWTQPIHFKTYKAGKSTVIEDCRTDSFIYEMEYIEELNPCKFIVSMTDHEGTVTTLESTTNRVILPITSTKPVDVVYYITSGYITTGVSDNYHYANANDTAFIATAVQASNLPYSYSNILKIDIQDTDITKITIPLSDRQSLEEFALDMGLPITPELEEFYNSVVFEIEGNFKKPCKYDVIVEKSNGEILEFNNISHHSFATSLIFGNQFNTNFYGDNVKENLTSFPIVIDFKEFLDAKVTITGKRFNHSYTVVLDYAYQRPPKPVKMIKAIADYMGGHIGYNYTLIWEQEPNTMYRITNLNTGDRYEVKGGDFSVTVWDRVDKFSIVSYNVSAITEPVELTFPEILPVTNVSTTDGNKIVTMDFKGVDNINNYELYIDNNLYMTTKATNFLLKQFKGEKDIIIRGVYKDALYDISGLPTVYKYTPVVITGPYTITHDIISEDQFLRVQVENDTIEDTVKWINFVVRGKRNAIVYTRTLDMPIDDFKHVFELRNTSELSTVYMEFVHGWTTVVSNVIDLREGLFLFNHNANSFGSYFE